MDSRTRMFLCTEEKVNMVRTQFMDFYYYDEKLSAAG